jgi:1,4-dihydroxy-2-naphthoyl-CoA hydrolase
MKRSLRKLWNLGMKFTKIEDGMIEASMPVDSRTIQPAGLLHGGASAALAETLGSVASLLSIDSDKYMPVGIELSVSHLKAVTTGEVTGRVTAIRRGRTLHVWSIEIRNPQGEITCTSRLTTMIVARRK